MIPYRSTLRTAVRACSLTVAAMAVWPVFAAAQGNIAKLEITIEDIGSHTPLEPIEPGGTVQIAPGQKIRMRMTAVQASGSRRYPKTKFVPNDTQRISVDGMNEEVGNITLTGRRVNEAGGAVPIQYEILEDWPMNDKLRTGRVYVQVVEPPDPPPPPPPPAPERRGVTFFQDDGFRGRSQEFFESDADLRDNPIGNDSVSSVRVAPGCTVTLFEDVGHRGRSVRVEGDVPSMGRVGFGNDSLSSFQIVCR
jgi:hypothetical protein